MTSSQPLSPAVIREAVEEAGYELVSGSACPSDRDHLL